MRPPFRLLAITPPVAPVPADLVSRWLGAGALDIALLLREPGTPAGQLLAPHGRLAAIRAACVARGIPVLLSIDASELGLQVPPDIAGLHLRGDPELALLERARRIHPVPSHSQPSAHPVPSDTVPSDSLPPARPVPSHSLTDPHTVPSDSLPRAPPVPSHSPGPWLGRSCHGAPRPGHALVDYTLFAPVFAPTTAQPGRPPGSKIPAGLAALRAWTAAPGAVIYALGGISPANAAACLAAGAHGLAGIGVFFGEPGQVAQDVAALREIVAASDRHVEPVSPR